MCVCVYVCIYICIIIYIYTVDIIFVILCIYLHTYQYLDLYRPRFMSRRDFFTAVFYLHPLRRTYWT